MEILDDGDAQTELRTMPGRAAVSTGWLVVIAVVVLLAVIRISGYLTRQIAREATKWCGVCGVEIVEGWVIYEVRPSTGDPMPTGGGRRSPTFFCRKHRPADAAATPWHA